MKMTTAGLSIEMEGKLARIALEYLKRASLKGGN
jgi:hypothetical protein